MAKSKRRRGGTRAAGAGQPGQPVRVSIGHDLTGQVAMFLGDPDSPDYRYMTFTAAQARELGDALGAEADRADADRQEPGRGRVM